MRKRYLSSIVLCVLVTASACAQISTPITKQGLRVQIEDLVQMPSTTSSTGSKPSQSPGSRARINFLRESPDGRFFINDLRGQIYTLDGGNTPQLYVDIDEFNGGGQSIFPASAYSGGLAAGLISFTFHPEFETNGQFYTIHMEDPDDTPAVPDFSTVDMRSGTHPVSYHTVVTEWTAADPSASTWNETTGTRRELLRTGTTSDKFFHPFGDLQFDPTAIPGDDNYGLLYVSGGDWGYINGAGAPQGSGTDGQPGQLQRLDTLAGTLMRIDPRSPTLTGGTAGLGDYTIPNDNPFVDGDSNTFDEIYAFGFRNGHRMAWDGDGDLFVSSIGHDNIEEVERIIPGGNYGWTNREGTFVNGLDTANGGNGDADNVFPINIPDAQDVDFRGEEYLYPVAQYDHGEGNAIAGGFVYQGNQIPQLQGKFVFGDIVNGRLFAADVNEMKSLDLSDPATTAAVEEIQLFTKDEFGQETDVDLRPDFLPGRVDLRFGIDNDGELFILTKTDGFVRRLVGEGSPTVLMVNREDGTITLSTSEEIDGYSVFSTAGALNSADGKWNSLEDQAIAGWEEAAPTSMVLSELNADGSLTLASGESVNLGRAFKSVQTGFRESVEDLAVEIRTVDGEILGGLVTYVGDDVNNNLVLFVDPLSGEATIENTSDFAVSIDGYSILSESSSLLPADGQWNSLADQALDDWEEAAPTTAALSELVAEAGGYLISAGANFDLGALFDPNGVEDLALEFLINGETAPVSGFVRYRLAGDFDLDGDVDGQDFVSWQQGFGTLYDTDDLAAWQQNYGNSLATLAVANGVPEPSAFAILLLAIACTTNSRRWQ